MKIVLAFSVFVCYKNYSGKVESACTTRTVVEIGAEMKPIRSQIQDGKSADLGRWRAHVSEEELRRCVVFFRHDRRKTRSRSCSRSPCGESRRHRRCGPLGIALPTTGSPVKQYPDARAEGRWGVASCHELPCRVGSRSVGNERRV